MKWLIWESSESEGQNSELGSVAQSHVLSYCTVLLQIRGRHRDRVWEMRCLLKEARRKRRRSKIGHSAGVVIVQWNWSGLLSDDCTHLTWSPGMCCCGKGVTMGKAASFSSVDLVGSWRLWITSSAAGQKALPYRRSGWLISMSTTDNWLPLRVNLLNIY